MQPNHRDLPNLVSQDEYPLQTENINIRIPPRARFGDISQITRHSGTDYNPISIINTEDNRWVVYADGYTHNADEEFPTKSSALDYATELYNKDEFDLKLAILIQDDRIQDIYFGKMWLEYRVIKSNSEGWVHGYKGDAEYSPGEEKESVIKGAKETVVEKGKNMLLIEDENGEITDIWINCFLEKPPIPDRFSDTISL